MWTIKTDAFGIGFGSVSAASLTIIWPLLLPSRSRVSFFTSQHSFITTTTSAGSCAHHTISGAISCYFSVHHSSPTRKARGSNPPGRTKSSTLWGAALFVLHGFYGAEKERIRTARALRFTSRGAETPRRGVSRARLGESFQAHQKAHCNVLYAVKRW